MQANEITPERLRRLADTKPGDGKVLSLFMNLDPSQFGTAPARSSQVRSLLDRAALLVRDDQGLSHAEREALKTDLARVERVLEGELEAKGAHGLAVYSSSAANLFEVLRLGTPVDYDVVIADMPCIEPLTRMALSETWCVLLANRRVARLFCGTPPTLEEIALVQDDVHGQHDQGGWSQARYQRGIEKEVADHLRHTAETAFERLKDRLPTGLIAGGPQELIGDLEATLHPYLADRLAGRIDVDVENSNGDQVLAAAMPHIQAAVRAREDDALARLIQGFSTGGAVGGLPDVLLVLQERRVETLLVDRGFREPGRVCPRCGLLATEGDTCPIDGSAMEPVADVVEAAVARAVTQSAQVLVLDDRPELGPHRHIAAVLRF
jgi:peptide chain release factor subunit 1